MTRDAAPARTRLRQPAPRTREPAPRRWHVAVPLGLAVAAATLLVTHLVLPGVLALAALCLLAVLVPTSRELSRRVLVAGATFLGWAPLMWLWKLPVSHAALLLAILAGLLSGWLVLDGPPGRRAARLLPRVRPADLGVLVSALLVAALYKPLLVSTTAEVALTRFLKGWDNTAHFDMAGMIVRHGVLINRLDSGPGGDWAYLQYPQGFHAAVAVLMEAVVGPDALPSQLVQAYGRGSALICLLTVVTVVAGVCSVPAMRRRPALALPSAVLVTSTFVLGPGGMVLHDGFPNFLVAAAMLACIPLIVAQMHRPTSLPLLVALGGAGLAVAHNWALLLIVGAVGALGVLLPLRRRRWPDDVKGWVPAAIVSALVVVGAGIAWSMLRHQPPLGELLDTPGGVSPMPVSTMIMTAALALSACVAAVLRLEKGAGTRSGTLVRTAWAGVPMLLGTALVVGVAWAQVVGNGDVSYYFWKSALAMQLVGVVVLVLQLPSVLPAARVRPGLSARVGAAASSLLAAGAAGLVYGLPMVQFITLWSGAAPGAAARQDAVATALTGPSVDAQILLQAADRDAASQDGALRMLLPFPSSKQNHPILVSQWYSALTGTWTNQTQELFFSVPGPEASDDEIVEAAQTLLDSDERVVVLVGPTILDQVRDEVRPADAERVQPW